MKISYLLSGWGHTGGFQVPYKFMDKLVERGHTVHAITPQCSVKWKPDFSREVTRRFNENHGLWTAVKKRIRGTSVGKQLLKVKQRRPVVQLSRLNEGLIRNWVEADITIATYCATAYAAFALSEKTNALYHMQHWEELFFPDDFHRSMARLTYFAPLGLIANSTWLNDTIRRKVGRNSRLLLPGIDTQVFHPRTTLREKFSVPGKFRIVSYYDPRAFKGWPDGLEAMKIVFDEAGPNRVEWLVFGGQPEESVDVPVRFVGTLFGESLAELYSTAHCVFMPSWYESFPLPPIEAMASGAAVVVTGTGTEDYAFDGVNALVRPARSPAQLAAAILDLVENPSKARKLAEAGLDTAKQLTWERAADKLEAILSEANAKPDSSIVEDEQLDVARDVTN